MAALHNSCFPQIFPPVADLTECTGTQGFSVPQEPCKHWTFVCHALSLSRAPNHSSCLIHGFKRAPAGPGDGDVEAARVGHKAEHAALVAAHGAEHYHVRLTPLVPVHRRHCHLRSNSPNLFEAYDVLQQNAELDNSKTKEHLK